MSKIGKVKITKSQYREATIKTKSEDIVIYDHKDLNHCFHGDTVQLNNDCKVEKIIDTNINKLSIPGILQINSKYKFGFNKKNMSIYRFVPLDWKYPDFMVASSLKGKNRYVLVKYSKWEDKLPQGCIVKVYEDFDYELLVHKWDIHTNQLKLREKFESNQSTSSKFFANAFFKKSIDFSPLTYFSKDDLQNHKDYRHIDVISIDPSNSLDIDDALSIQKIDNQQYLLGIHIADVSFYIKYLNLYDQIRNRISSIYLPNKVINMLPNILANNICSLREGCDRLAVTLWINIKNGKYQEYSIERTIIRNRKQYDYDNPILVKHELYKLSQKIAQNNFDMSVDQWDTHKMVETYMILCNHLIAFLLKDNNKMVFRIHEKKDESFYIKPPRKLENIIKILNSKSAIYQMKKDSYYHFGLNLEYYTHFTSPLRRFVDVYIHSLLFGDVNLIDCDEINEFNNKVKKIERDIAKHQFFEYVKQNNGHIVEPHIIGINKFCLTLYLIEWKLMYKYNFVEKSIQHLWKIIEDQNEITYCHKPSYDHFELKLYQKINIRVWYLEDKKDILIQPSFISSF